MDSPEDLGLIPLGNAPWAASPESMTLDERAVAYAVLTFLCKQLEARKAALRGPLLEEAKIKGTPNKNGSSKLTTEQAGVQAVKIPAREPPFAALRALLDQKGIPLDDAYDRVENWLFNASKLKILVDRGYIAQDEVDALLVDAYNLRVSPSKDLKSRMIEAGKQVFGSSESLQDTE